MSRIPFALLLPAVLAGPLLAGSLLAGHAAAAPALYGPDLHYGGANFAAIAATSYRLAHLSGTFDDWLAGAYQTAAVGLSGGPESSAPTTLNAALDARRAALGRLSGPQRAALERDTAQWAHTFVKTAIPKFSLERGFELASVVQTGERQCLAQSVIIAALLQRAGVQAGAVMVWKNDRGLASNLGHVVTVVHLSSGHDLLDDASDPQPFMRHQGVLVRDGVNGPYRFVTPTYGSAGPGAQAEITGYTRADGGGALSPTRAAPLGLSYLQSQFDYYRGERAPGGFMGPSTAAGLNQSVKFLKRAVDEEPSNALAQYVLGHTYRKLKQDALARAQYRRAASLYAAEGHQPAGLNEIMTWVAAQKTAPQKTAPGSS